MTTRKNSTQNNQPQIAPVVGATENVDPVTTYLASLAASGRSPIRSLLRQVVRIRGSDREPERFPWHEMTYEDVAAIRAHLVGVNKSASTINTTLAAVRGVLRTAYYMNRISLEQLSRVGRVPFVRTRGTTKGRALTKSEVRRLLSACRQDTTPHGLRDC